mmetsp:Transcript_39551/g.87988  ORF Transcript_39551/g.87988 Transcript_39551/m.87988 type:complete len:130 (+) Transcript_39551:131-520(+)
MSSKVVLAAATAGDPKRPNEVKRYVPPKYDPEANPDVMLIGATMLGMFGLWFKVRMASWGALIMVLSSVLNMKSGQYDMKQLVMTSTFAIMGLAAAYITPQMAARAAALKAAKDAQQAAEAAAAATATN